MQTFTEDSVFLLKILLISGLEYLPLSLHYVQKVNFPPVNKEGGKN